MNHTGDPAVDARLWPQLVTQSAQGMSRGIPNFRVVDQGPTTVGGTSAYQLRFTGRVDQAGGQGLDVWGRAIIVPGTGGARRGAYLILLATSASQEVRSLDDVGVRGGLPVILNSFRLAAPAASAAAPGQSAPASAEAPAAPAGADGGGKPPESNEAPASQEQGGYEEQPSGEYAGEESQAEGGGK